MSTDDDDIIDITNTTQYVQVNNAHTSPMTTFYGDDDFSTNESKHHFQHYSPDYNQSEYSKYNSNTTTSSELIHLFLEMFYRLYFDKVLYLDYVPIRQKMDIDRTLSKYRSEINEILTTNVLKSRENLSQSSLAQKYLEKSPYELASTKTQSNELRKRADLLGSHTKHSPRDFENERPLSGFISGRPARNAMNGQMGTKNNAHMQNRAQSGSLLSSLYNEKLKAHIANLGMTISKLLPYLVVIVFTVIILQYANVKFFTKKSIHRPQSSKANPDLALFDESIVQQDPDASSQFRKVMFCSDIKDTQCIHTKNLIRQLIDYLRAKSGQIDCLQIVDNQMNQFGLPINFIEKCVHVNTIRNFLTSNCKLIKDKMHESDALWSVMEAVKQNPHWNIRLLGAQYNDIDDLNQVVYFMSTISNKSLWCRCKELAYFVYTRALMLGAIGILLIAAYFVYGFWARMNKNKEREFFDLINKVTNIVRRQQELSCTDSNNIKPYIAVAHVYHSLFDPIQRANNHKLWAQVVNFIKNHESRIHLETHFIDGEETEVWKWVLPLNTTQNETLNSKSQLQHQPSSSKASNSIGLANSTMISSSSESRNLTQSNTSSKSNTGFASTDTASQNGWQGDAFLRSDKLSHSPTPCLKIRNMLDTERESTQLDLIKIQNDILEKCCMSSHGIQNQIILHIAFDNKSKEGCVYVKCVSNEGAGRVYQALNGTWYSGRLLNVKFLRSDRYLERFPDSINFNKPIQYVKF